MRKGFLPPYPTRSLILLCNHGKHPVSVEFGWGPAIKGYWASLRRKHRFVNQAKAKQLLEPDNQWFWTNNKSLVAASKNDKWKKGPTN